MRKAIIAALIVVILIVGIYIIISFAQLGTSSIPQKPNDTSLEFWICDNVAEFDWSGYDEIVGWMGAKEYLGKGYHAEEGKRPQVRVSYIITPWPDYASGGNYVTTIEITDPDVSVYGLTIDSDSKKFEEVMTSMGYKVELINNDLIKAVKGDFTFSLQHGNLQELSISTEIRNRDGIMF